MKIRVVVTEADIKKGTRHDGAHCPIARAIRRHKDLKHAWVGIHHLYVDQHLRMETAVDLPPEAVSFAVNFDRANHRQFEPFSFPLDIPDENLEKEKQLDKEMITVTTPNG